MPSGGNAGINENTAALKFYNITPNSNYFTTSSIKIIKSITNELFFIDNLLIKPNITIPISSNLLELPAELTPTKTLSFVVIDSNYNIIPLTLWSDNRLRNRVAITSSSSGTYIYLAGSVVNINDKFY